MLAFGDEAADRAVRWHRQADSAQDGRVGADRLGRPEDADGADAAARGKHVRRDRLEGQDVDGRDLVHDEVPISEGALVGIVHRYGADGQVECIDGLACRDLVGRDDDVTRGEDRHGLFGVLATERERCGTRDDREQYSDDKYQRATPAVVLELHLHRWQAPVAQVAGDIGRQRRRPAPSWCSREHRSTRSWPPWTHRVMAHRTLFCPAPPRTTRTLASAHHHVRARRRVRDRAVRTWCVNTRSV